MFESLLETNANITKLGGLSSLYVWKPVLGDGLGFSF